MDFPVAANLYLEVEEGLLGEGRARTMVRHVVRGLERVEKLINVVDVRYVCEAGDEMLAREMRSWASSSSLCTPKGSGACRAGPYSNSW